MDHSAIYTHYPPTTKNEKKKTKKSFQKHLQQLQNLTEENERAPQQP
jgi:hypothetical protein